MRKFVIILLVACLVIGGGALYFFGLGNDEEADVAIKDGTQETETTDTAGPDYEALHALHDADEVVATVNGKDVLWSEYFYWIASNTAQVQNYIDQMAYYGMEINWSDPIEEGGDTYAQYVIQATENSLLQMHAIEEFAAENGVELTAEDEAELAETLKEDIASTCGEDATEEAFKAFLEENFLNMDLYSRLNSINHLYQNGFTVLFGENGEKISDEDALYYLQENGYMTAAHILISTVDSATGEDLSEEQIAEKKAKADEIYAELSAITDTEELLKRFAELKEEYCEDSGKASYPDGYVFQDGKMVAEFENAVKALEVNGLSEPVRTSYGYHIILRLADNADMTIEYSDSGTPMTARSMFANNKYGEQMQQKLDSMEIKYLFDAIDILSFIK